MTTYNEALKIILERIRTLEIEEKPLTECVGQVSAEDIYADYDLPMMDTSGPDGYAVRSADLVGASKDTPVKLRIIETLRAGFMPKKTVAQGTASRIMTGSILPQGADCVVRFEDTDEPGNKNGPNNNNPETVEIYALYEAGDCVLQAGVNLKKGALVLQKGSVIGPVQISGLTSAGKTRIKVYRQPVIAVISTGDELIELGQSLSPEKIFNCNTPALNALIKHYGCIPQVLGIAKDTEESLTQALRKGLNADVIVTSGGVSKGDFDLVRLVLEKNGKVFLAKINMGPGASFTFGEYHVQSKGNARSIPVFALAGPPSGCIINFETLVRPALLKLLGFDKIDHSYVEAIAEDAIPEKRAVAIVKWTNLRQIDGQYCVKLNTSEKGSVISMVNANSLTIIPSGTTVQVGDRMRVFPLDYFPNRLF